MKHVLSIDQGTTSSRAIVYDETLRVRGVGQYPFEQIFPHPGWVEHDPEAIWQTSRDAINAALEAAEVSAKQISAIGITNQRETIVVWNKLTGEAINNAIVWQDRRTAPTCLALEAQGVEGLVSKKTGLLLDPYFSATKIRWILDNVPQAEAAAARGELLCGTIDSWLIWKLTAGQSHVIEVSNASRTSLLNLQTGNWDDELLAIFDIPRAILPTVVESSGLIAEAQIPPLKGIPITGAAGDQQAALFGQNCFTAGDTKCTYGTGCFLLTNIGHEPILSNARLLTTVAWSINQQLTYALEGSVFIGGALVQWLRDNLAIIERAQDIEALAESVADNGGVTLVPAFAGLGAPYWDPDARGTFLGITRGTTKAHIARAALEAIAHQVTDVIEVMHDDLAADLTTMRVDGGACNNNLLMQMQADFSHLQVMRAANLESTALGAAMLAGLGAGVWAGIETLEDLWQVDSKFSPLIDEQSRASARTIWRRAIERAGGWAS